MRNAFFQDLKNIALTHKDVYLLTANLGFKLFDDFRAACPEYFIDVGVAEANMIGIASGLSQMGKNVYCYSIIPFLVMRAYEQIRVDVAYHNLNVKLIGVGGGFTYGLEGFTHHGIEDLSLMRSMPNMNVVVPADIKEAKQLAGISYDFPYPLYIRLGRSGEPPVHSEMPKFRIGKGMILSEGKDIAIFAVGNMVYQSQQIIKSLGKRGISVTLINMHTIKPLDVKLIRECASTHKYIFTVEEHTVNGGLGSAVAETLAEYSFKGKFQRIGIPEKLKRVIGTPDFLRKQYGLTSDQILDKVIKIIKKD